MSNDHFTDPKHYIRKALVFKNWVRENGRKWDECYQGIHDCILSGWVDCDDTGRLWLTDLGIAKQALSISQQSRGLHLSGFRAVPATDRGLLAVKVDEVFLGETRLLHGKGHADYVVLIASQSNPGLVAR